MQGGGGGGSSKWWLYIRCQFIARYLSVLTHWGLQVGQVPAMWTLVSTVKPVLHLVWPVVAGSVYLCNHKDCGMMSKFSIVQWKVIAVD